MRTRSFPSRGFAPAVAVPTAGDDFNVAGYQVFVLIRAAAFGADATGQSRCENGAPYRSVDADADAGFALALTGAPALVAGECLP